MHTCERRCFNKFPSIFHFYPKNTLSLGFYNLFSVVAIALKISDFSVRFWKLGCWSQNSSIRFAFPAFPRENIHRVTRKNNLQLLRRYLWNYYENVTLYLYQGFGSNILQNRFLSTMMELKWNTIFQFMGILGFPVY